MNLYTPLYSKGEEEKSGRELLSGSSGAGLPLDARLASTTSWAFFHSSMTEPMTAKSSTTWVPTY